MLDLSAPSRGNVRGQSRMLYLNAPSREYVCRALPASFRRVEKFSFFQMSNLMPETCNESKKHARINHPKSSLFIAPEVCSELSVETNRRQMEPHCVYIDRPYFYQVDVQELPFGRVRA